jgi:pimeloyl-ACP methyl ester carboxylesterase
MDRISAAAPQLVDVPELTNAALDSAREDPEIGCLIDRVYPGRPLIISFGFNDWQRMPNFDFFGRTKKLEKRFGITFNRLLIRDVANAWYHRGVPGLGAHVDEVAATLRSLVRAIRPSEVITMGQSMGGYGAIMFGMLLGADRIVAFGPQSHLDPSEAARYGDCRFLPVLEALQANPPKSAYIDLPQLGEALGYQGRLDVIFGTHPGHDDGNSGNLDAIHAFRLARLPNVSLSPYPESVHAVVQWLADHKQLDDLLAELLVPGPPIDEPAPVTSTARSS